MNGREVANAYTELNDPVTQAECFAQQAKVCWSGPELCLLILKFCGADEGRQTGIQLSPAMS